MKGLSRFERILALAIVVLLLGTGFTLWGYYQDRQRLSELVEEKQAERGHLETLSKTMDVEALKQQLSTLSSKLAATESGLIGDSELDTYSLVSDAAQKTRVTLTDVRRKPVKDVEKGLTQYRISRYGVSAEGGLIALKDLSGEIGRASSGVLALDAVDLSLKGGSWILNLDLVVLYKAY